MRGALSDGVHPRYRQSLATSSAGMTSQPGAAYQGVRAQMRVDQRVKMLLAGAVPGAWFEASRLQSLYQSTLALPAPSFGEAVGTWADKSPKGSFAVQTTATARPLHTGPFHALTFDGVDDFLLLNAIVRVVYRAAASGLQAACFRMNQTGATQTIVAFSTSNSTQNLFTTAVTAAGAIVVTLRRTLNGTGGSVSTADNFVQPGVVYAVVATVDWLYGGPDSTKLYINGVLIATSAWVDIGMTQNATAPNARFGTGLGGVSFFNGELFAVVLRAASISHAEMLLLTEYLLSRAGIAGVT